MDINQVRFGSYSIGNPNNGAKKSEAKNQEQVQPQVKSDVLPKDFDVDGLFNAMGLAGLQNKAAINFVAKKEVNPADYLTQDRIADIEAMMAGFENGVNTIASAIDGEFGGAMSAAQKNALAAQIYAQE